MDKQQKVRTWAVTAQAEDGRNDHGAVDDEVNDDHLQQILQALMILPRKVTAKGPKGEQVVDPVVEEGLGEPAEEELDGEDAGDDGDHGGAEEDHGRPHPPRHLHRMPQLRPAPPPLCPPLLLGTVGTGRHRR